MTTPQQSTAPDPNCRRALDGLAAQHGGPPRLSCSLVAHRDLGVCASCKSSGIDIELAAWRLLAMAERGIPLQPSEARDA